MQLQNNASPSFQGSICIGSAKKGHKLIYSTPEQDSLIRKAANYFLNGEADVKMDETGRSTFSEILNKIVGEKILVNKQEKKLSQIEDSWFIYRDNLPSRHVDEYVTIDLNA